MYKTTRCAQLPEYMDYSPREANCMTDIQLESTPRPQYRIFSMNHHNQATRSRSDTSFSDNISLTPSASRSATQDLAEFLRTSSPEDYKRFLGPSSPEDLTGSAVSQKRSFRFLKSSTPRSSSARSSATTSAAVPLPNKNVVSKTTSRGKPYLQINVDYGQNYHQSHTTITATRQASYSSETSSDKYHRSSTVTSSSTSADSGISFPTSYTAERPSISPPLSRAAQESRVSLDTATMGRYQQFLDSRSGHNHSGDSPEAKVYSSPTDIVSAGMAEFRAFQEFQRLQGMKTPPRTPEFSSIPRTSSDFLSLRCPPRHRSQTNSTRSVRAESREVSARSSVVSDLFDDITDTEFEGTPGPHGQRKKCRKTPPRPGPPPSRSLPSLPEGHDDSASKSPSESHETLHVCNSQISLTSTNASACSHLDDAHSIRSNRKSREERVKVRKAKDLSRHLQLMVEKKPEEKSVVGGKIVVSDSSTHLPSSGDLGEMGRSTPRRSGSGRRPSSDKSNRSSSIAVVLSEHLASSVNNLPRNHLPETPQTPTSLELANLGNESPHLSAPTPAPLCSGKEIELEARMLAIERKNKLLEQALMAVIRSAMKGQTQRRTELLKANVLEELLDEIDLVEFAAGGQVN